MIARRSPTSNIASRLIDYLGGPFLRFQGIRGRVFFDIGAAYYSYSPVDFKFYDSQAKLFVDGRAAYGWGVTINLLGLDLNWDFSKQYRSPVGLTTNQHDGLPDGLLDRHAILN